jgi:hypothetical protein
MNEHIWLLVIPAVNRSSFTGSYKYSREVLCTVTQPCSLKGAISSATFLQISIRKIDDYNNNNGGNFCAEVEGDSERFVTGGIEGLFYSFCATFPHDFNPIFLTRHFHERVPLIRRPFFPSHSA